MGAKRKIEKIVNEFVRMDGVKHVTVQSPIIHISIEVDRATFMNRQFRNKIYQKQLEIMNMFPDLYLDFNLTVQGDSGDSPLNK